jgi:hypothetical protein
MQPSEAELRETIERMEQRLRAHPLFPAYVRLADRFAADLRDERDALLSRAAVLMLLQETASRASGS